MQFKCCYIFFGMVILRKGGSVKASSDVGRQACNMPKWYMQKHYVYSHPNEGRKHIYGIHIYVCKAWIGFI